MLVFKDVEVFFVAEGLLRGSEEDVFIVLLLTEKTFKGDDYDWVIDFIGAESEFVNHYSGVADLFFDRGLMSASFLDGFGSISEVLHEKMKCKKTFNIETAHRFGFFGFSWDEEDAELLHKIDSGEKVFYGNDLRYDNELANDFDVINMIEESIRIKDLRHGDEGRYNLDWHFHGIPLKSRYFKSKGVSLSASISISAI